MMKILSGASLRVILGRAILGLNKSQVFGASLFAFLVINLTSVSVVYAANPQLQTNLAKASNTVSSNAYAFNRCRKFQAKPFDKKSRKKKVIIIGDSQGCDFLNGALENGYLKNYQIQFRFVPFTCQRVPWEGVEKYIEPRHRNFCLKSGRADSLEKAKEQVKQANMVIFAALWKTEVAKKLHQTFRYLGVNKNQQVVVVGNKFFGKMTINNYIHMPDRELKSLRNDVGTDSQDVNSILKKQVANRGLFVDTHRLICGDSSTCPVFTNNLRLISYDGRHLTRSGARYIGKIMFQRTGLGRI